ncbi:MAG: hypothetical protein JNK21_16065 [Rhodospirillaceae bacterium]|nr:hypothetical protein [Rhodospirillaceae bacterium]
MAKKPKKAKSKPAKGKTKAKAKPKAVKKSAGKAAKTKPASAIPADLEKRLKALAKQMDTTLDAVMLQALCEFADAWEDHFRNVTVLTAEEEERVQIVVKPD